MRRFEPRDAFGGTSPVMFGLNTIARKLPLALVGSAAIVSLGVRGGAFLIGSQMVGDMTQRNLSSLAYERAKQVDHLKGSITNDVETTANSMAANKALRDFGNAWLQLQGDRAGQLIDDFVKANNNPPDKRMMMDDGPSSLNFLVSHTQWNPTYRQQLLTNGYADIYLIGADGNIYFSVTKGSDYAGNVKDPASPLAGSGLAKVFAQATAQTAPNGAVAYADFAPYGADHDISAFVGLPIFNTASARMMGIVAFRFRPDLVANVVGDRTGLGDFV